MLTTKVSLMKAYTLIDENGWTQGAEARTAKGKAVEAIEPLAVSWDAEGAIHAMLSKYRCGPGSFDATVSALQPYCDGMSITAWNDHPERTKEEVLEAFEHAIKAC